MAFFQQVRTSMAIRNLGPIDGLVLILFLLSARVSGSELSPETADYPRAILDNGLLRAVVVLPDGEKGYYRGPRFDASGMVAQVDYQGHTFFAPFEDPLTTPHDPTIANLGIGTSDEFGIDDALGYREAKPAGPFMKVGVGMLKRHKRDDYVFYMGYRFLERGMWEIERDPEGRTLRFRQTLGSPQSADGYAYAYEKVVALEAQRPVLRITRTLKNTGSRPISTDHYCHNILRIDGAPIGPSYRIRLFFAPSVVEARPEGVWRIEGETITFDQPITAEAVLIFAPVPADPRLPEVEILNKESGAHVRIRRSLALTKCVLYALPHCLSPEMFSLIELAPGDSVSWWDEYEFGSCCM